MEQKIKDLMSKYFDEYWREADPNNEIEVSDEDEQRADEMYDKMIPEIIKIVENGN